MVAVHLNNRRVEPVDDSSVTIMCHSYKNCHTK